MVTFLKRHVVLATALTVLLTGAVGVAVAQEGSGESQHQVVGESLSPEEVEAANAAVTKECGHPPPCMFVNGNAVSGDDGGEPVTVQEELSEDGRPAGECPEVTKAYASVGVKVDGYIGPCPDVADTPSQTLADEVVVDPANLESAAEAEGHHHDSEAHHD